MSLLDECMEDFTIMNRLVVDDSYGGTKTIWEAGATIQAALYNYSSMEARTAEKQGVTALYTVVTRKDINLQYHEVLQRKSDGKIFRILSDGDDNHTPESATLNMREVQAEEWAIPK